MNKIKNQLRRAFTIVELVVVIAVIAALAAILIPTFVNVVNSANESNDMITVKNLNTAVATEDTLSGVETVSDAIDAALANGYSVSNLSPTSDGNIIVYDQESKRFALISEDMETVVYGDSSTTKTNWNTYTTWVFVDAAATSNSYVTITGDSSNGYTIKGNNSYILTGSDWDGVDVTASYGVELYDYTSGSTTTLNSVTITNNDNPSTDAGNVSLVKNVKTATDESASANKITITINVKAKSLSYKGTAYSVLNYSVVTKTTSIDTGKSNSFTSYGVSGKYEATSGTLSVKYIDDVTIISIADGADSNNIKIDISSLSAEQASKLLPTENAINIINSSNSNPKVTNTVSNGATVNDDGTITFTTKDTDGNEIEYTFTKDNITTEGIQIGTELYPYLIYDKDGFLAIFTTNSDKYSCLYYKLMADIDLSQESESSVEPVISFSLDGNGFSLTGDLLVYSDSDDINITIKQLTYNGITIGDVYTELTNLVLAVTGDIELSDCNFVNETTKSENLQFILSLAYMNSVTISDCSFEQSRVCIMADNTNTEKTSSQAELPITITGTTFTGDENTGGFYSLSYQYVSGVICIVTNATNVTYGYNQNDFAIDLTLSECSFSGEVKYGVYFYTESATNESLNITLDSVTFESSLDPTKDTDYNSYSTNNRTEYECPALLYVSSSDKINSEKYSEKDCTFTWNNDTISNVTLSAYKNIYGEIVSSENSEN